ncbi:MAG: hypothetical protein IJD17_03095 [Clostridia bacterium]|nr:hypothetical protein [Clostridia bacterium]
MARERYLRGISEEELRPDPRPIEKPRTPKSWLENFWYHHKVGVLIGAFTVIALTILIVQTVTRERPDYTAVMVTENGLLPDEVTYLEQVLAQYGEDINGDGEVVVQINSLFLGGKQYANQDANAQSLQMQLITGDTLLYLYEPTYEERLTAVGRDNAHCFLTELAFTAEGVSEDKLCWNWTEHTRRAQDVILANLPKELCFGVRYAVPDDEESAEEYAQVVKLLEAFATEQPTAK